MLGFIIRNSKNFRYTKTKILLYCSLVRNILEYNSIVWRPHFAYHCLRLERVQKRFAWHLAFSDGIAKRERSYEKRLAHFNMASLAKRRQILDSMFAYKIIKQKIDSPCLLALFSFRAPSRIPRSAITPLCPPFRRTVLGSSSPYARMCKAVNG